MKYARLRVAHDADRRHPMHAFEMRHDDIERATLCHWNAVLDGTNAMVFRVRGDPDPFRAKLDARTATVAYALTEAVDGVFYCCVRDRATDADRRYIDAFARGTLVVVPPVAFEPDGTTRLTVVGTASDIEAAVESLPARTAVGPGRRLRGLPTASARPSRPPSTVATTTRRGRGASRTWPRLSTSRRGRRPNTSGRRRRR